MFFKCIRDRRQVIQAKMPGGLVGQLYTRRNRSDVKCIHCSDSWYFSSTITTSRKRFQYMYYALDVCIMRRAGFFFKSRRWYGRQSNTTVCILGCFKCDTLSKKKLQCQYNSLQGIYKPYPKEFFS